MVQLPRHTRLVDLLFGIESLVLGHSLGKAKIIPAVVVTIDAGIAWRKHNLFVVMSVDMKAVVAIAIVKSHMKLRL